MTNSSSILLSSTIASFVVALRRAGPCEIATYAPGPAATHGLSANHFKQLIPAELEPVRETLARTWR